MFEKFFESMKRKKRKHCAYTAATHGYAGVVVTAMPKEIRQEVEAEIGKPRSQNHDAEFLLACMEKYYRKNGKDFL